MRYGIDRRKIPRVLVLSASVIALVLVSLNSNLVSLTEKLLEDNWYRVYPEKRPEDRIVVVEIDDETLESYFPEIPLPRGQIALMIDHLAGPLVNARTIVIDLYFEGPDKSDPSDDTLLAHIISAHSDRVVCALYFSNLEWEQPVRGAVRDSLLERFSYELPGLACPIDNEANIPPAIFLQSARFYGHIDVFHDETNTPRELPLFVRSNGALIGALAIEAVRNFLSIDRSAITLDGNMLSLAGQKIPLDESGTMKIRHFRNKAGYPHYSMLNLLERFKQGGIPHDLFGDKIVLIGINSKTYYPKEFYYTPFGEEKPNVYLHADIISNILSGSFVRGTNQAVTYGLIIIIGLGFILIQSLSGRASRLLISSCLILCIIVADFVFFKSGVDFKAVPLLLICLPLSVYTYFGSFREQAEIIKTQEKETLELRKKEVSLLEMEQEIKVARAIQERLLPESIPNVPGYDIFGVNLAAKGISGDFFDFIKLSDDRLVIVVADGEFQIAAHCRYSSCAGHTEIRAA